MKQLIVLLSSIVLGVFIFELVAGDGDNSVLSCMQDLWSLGLAERSFFSS